MDFTYVIMLVVNISDGHHNMVMRKEERMHGLVSVTYKNKLQTKKVLIYVDVDVHVHCTINYMIRMEVMTNIDIGVQI